MKRYAVEVGGGMLGYSAALAVSLYLLAGDAIEAPQTRMLVSLAPMAFAALICWATVRQIRRLDELQSRIQVEALALAVMATAIVTFSYGFLENVGFPKLTMFIVWPLMAVFWSLGVLIGHLRYR